MALSFVLPLLPLIVSALALQVTDIQGPAFQSPYLSQVVSVSGTVTAKGASGFWLAGSPSEDIRVSNGIMVYSTASSVLNTVTVGDSVSLSAEVAEFRSNSRPDDLFLTELLRPTNITILSSGNWIEPIVLGIDRSPPTQRWSSLDEGLDGALSVPNGVNRVENVNATLEPNHYGLDFWESLEGQLVKVRHPTALNFENRYGDFWMHGDWPVTGKNKRGGLTINFGPDGTPDVNPEVLMVGPPLDGSKNPKTLLGATLEDITGVITYQFGFYYILPLSAPVIKSRPSLQVAPTVLTSPKLNIFNWLWEHCKVTVGVYNVENLTPKSPHLPAIAQHIGEFLKTPDVVFLQEIQDNSGSANDGVVSANETLAVLAAAVNDITGVRYSFVEVESEDGKDGGQPGGNIRPAYFYRPERVSLVKGTQAGGPLDSVKVSKQGLLRLPKLNFNPGRIDPTNDAWTASRKPIAAQWATSSGSIFFTINLHNASKGGSGSTQGDPRPPMNGGVDQRTNQVAAIASFVKSILDIDKRANIIVAGDFNEYFQTRSVFNSLTSIMSNIDEAAGVDPTERYTYIFDQNTQQLDQAFISPAIAKRKVEVEHVHVNNHGAASYAARISDHDPTVARLRLC